MSDPTAFTDPNRAALEELADALDLGVGRFSLHLVRCRYRQMQEQLATQLQTICRESYDLELERITLEASAQNLYTSIQKAVGDRPPQALMVLGMEQVTNLDEVLGATEIAREEFRKNFHFPLVLWLDDDRYIHFTRQAPNIASWSPGTTDLAIEPVALKCALNETAKLVRFQLLNPTVELLPQTLRQLPIVGLAEALEELHEYNLTLGDREEALVRMTAAFHLVESQLIGVVTPESYFHHSAEFWAQHLKTTNVTTEDYACAGIVHFFWGRHLAWMRDQQRRRGEVVSGAAWEVARQPLERAMQWFEAGDRPDLIAKCLSVYQRVLSRIEDWDTLEHWAQRGVELHRTYDYPLKLAYDHGFLSRVYLERQEWHATRDQAAQALEILEQLPPRETWLRGLYHLHLALAEKALGHGERAIALLWEAQKWGDRAHPLTYCRILDTLRQLYWEQGRYLDAFKLKQERLEVEKDAGIIAFVGAGRLGRAVQTIDDLYGVAPEIEASGRKRDLERLLERIAQNDYKLIVIHGPSGVGKSSLIHAGLIPALRQYPIGTKGNLSLVFQQYIHWKEHFWEQLARELDRLKEPFTIHPTPGCNQPTLQDIFAYLHQLYSNPDEVIRFRSVIIFDQFEEFFFAYPDHLQWREFFQFLGNCLYIPDVKVVLSLREDYIHYLLEANRADYMGAIGHDILGRQVLYPLGNLSLPDAHATIQDLTNRSRFSLAPNLIDRLVQDLGGPLQEVRPIEMQIVGAQLQTEGISTLEAYEALGDRPTEVLVKRCLEEVYVDCAEHGQLASLVLFLLTDERGIRPLKTRSELEKELATLLPPEAFTEPASPLHKGGLRGDSPQPPNPENPPKSPFIKGTSSAADTPEEPESLAPLDLVLRVICGSGIGVFLPEEPEGRYQLVHDYIAEFIRQQQGNKLIAELEEERQQRLAVEAERALLAAANQKANRRLRNSLSLLIIAVALLIFAITLLVFAFTLA